MSVYTFLEKLVSEKIATALTTAGATLPINHFWQRAAEGTVRKDARSKIAVIIDPRGSESWGSKKISLTGQIAIESAIEDDPDGDIFVDNFEAVIVLLQEWQESNDSEMAAALSVDGLRVDGMQFSVGGSAGIDTASGIWFAVMNFELKGYRVAVVVPPEE